MKTMIDQWKNNLANQLKWEVELENAGFKDQQIKRIVERTKNLIEQAEKENKEWGTNVENKSKKTQ